MANLVARNQADRKVEVRVVMLIDQLIKNRDKHILEYNNAKKVYTDTLLQKLHDAVVKAQDKLVKAGHLLRAKIADFTDEDVKSQSDQFLLVDAVYVNMAVPRSFAHMYDAAIDMFRWETREIVELTYAEFQCFVRDVWDWTEEWSNVSKMYVGSAR
jgi:hypothetical protein